jgi:hypothetical protein
VQRHLVVATLLFAAGCAKRADKGSAQSAPTPEPAAATGGAAPGNGSALEAARNQASLGASAPTSAFEPLDDKGKDPKAVMSAPTVKRGREQYEVALSVTVADQPAPPVLTAVLTTSEPQLRACFEKRPSATGVLRIAFTVLPTGTLSAVNTVKTTVKDVDIEACIIGVIGTLKLGKPLAATETKAVVELTRS